MGRLLKTKELLTELNCSNSVLRKLINQGIPHICVGKRLRRFDVDVVRAWLNEQFLVGDSPKCLELDKINDSNAQGNSEKKRTE